MNTLKKTNLVYSCLVPSVCVHACVCVCVTIDKMCIPQRLVNASARNEHLRRMSSSGIESPLSGADYGWCRLCETTCRLT